MKRSGVYFLGFVVLIIGLLAGLAKAGVLASIGAGWTVIGVVILLGIGLIYAVSNSGTRDNVIIDKDKN